MKPGLPLSVTLHAAVLGWALVSFASVPPLEATPSSDPIDVELLPPTAVSQPKLGQKTAKPAETITPKDTKAAAKETEGKRVGSDAHEEPPPPPPEAKPVPPDPKPAQVAAVPPPEPKPEPKPEPPPKPPEPKPEPKPPEPKPPEPKPEPKPVTRTEPPAPQPKHDLPVEAEKAKAVGEGKPPEVKQPPKDEKALDKLIEAKTKEEPKKEEPKKDPPKKPDPKPVDKAPPKTDATKAAAAKPAPPTTASSKPAPAKPSTNPSKLAGEVTDINNRVNTASSAARTEQHASLGTPTGPATNAKLSQSEMEALIGMLRSRLMTCWSPPPGASESGVVATLVIQLNQDGTLKAAPQLLAVTPASHPQANSIVQSAERAVRKCAAEAPFKLPPDKYAAWAVNNIKFDPKNQ